MSFEAKDYPISDILNKVVLIFLEISADMFGKIQLARSF